MTNPASGPNVESVPVCIVLAPDDGEYFDQLVRIYQAAIVASEQKSPAELREMLSNPRYRVLVARDASGTVIGFAILYFPSAGAFWLLEYMAVDTRLRSRGLGAHMFAAARQLAGTIVGSAPCVLEVDQPHAGATDDDASRRLRFYHRLGCRRIAHLNYVLPLREHGTPPAMWLLVHGLEGRAVLSADELRTWLRHIYVEVYNRKPDDPRIIMMMSHADELNGVRMLQLF